MKLTGNDLKGPHRNPVTGKFRFRKALLLLAAPVALLCGCSDDDPAPVAESPGNDIIYLRPDAGSTKINISAQGNWQASLDDSDWISITSAGTGNGDGSIIVAYGENDSFGRLSVLTVKTSADERTVQIRQVGITPILDLKETTFIVPGSGSLISSTLYTNLTEEMLSRTVIRARDGDGEDTEWVSGLNIDTGAETVVFRVNDNGTSARREFAAELVYTDVFDMEHTASVDITQLGVSPYNPTSVSFADLKGRIAGSSGELVISDDISISGVIISDRTFPNVAANPQTSQTAIDRTVNYRTAYLQDEAGISGIMILMDSVELNVFTQFDNLTLALKDATLIKKSNPERYRLEGIGFDHYVTLTQGTASDVPARTKYIGELTDADIYTYVTLRDVEIPIREGTYTPINEGYAGSYNVNRIDMFPIILRDIRGGSLYTYTNIDVPYRRDGSPLPQGSGTVSGVVVHEKFTRYEQDGYIGAYQIRHLAKSDINISEDFAGGFSNIIAEWVTFETGSSSAPTEGTGSLSMSTGNFSARTRDYSYLGPITGDQNADNNKGEGTNGGIAANGWVVGKSWVIEFSTAGISSGPLSMQISTVNNAVGGPRFMAAEWSEHGDHNQPWEHVADYTVPDITVWDNTLLTQLPAFKYVNFELPDAMLGRNTVYVRLRMTSDKGGSSTGYDNGTVSTSVNNAIGYIGIRHNK